MGGKWIGNDGAGSNGFHFERDLLCTVDSNGYFTSLNGGWERLLGWTGEELMSRPVRGLHPPRGP